MTKFSESIQRAVRSVRKQKPKSLAFRNIALQSKAIVLAKKFKKRPQTVMNELVKKF